MTPPFSTLGLSAPLLGSAAKAGFDAPTPVQSAAIPAVLLGRDVWAQAETGSGKTAAFALPVLQRLLERLQSPGRGHSARGGERVARALVLVPTRELAAQVGDVVQTLSRELPEHIKVISAWGGGSINPQLMALRGGADIVVATPGRLLDLLDHNGLHLGGVETLVLDEADRLLDLGFADELRRILALLPAQRQNLLFSATFPPEVTLLAANLLHDPLRIELAAAQSTPVVIEQRAIAVEAAKRTPLLRHLIETCVWPRVLVFVATRYATLHVADKLRRSGIDAQPFNGELSQGARTRALAGFKAGTLRVLVATDVAARGIDIVQLPAVVNYDLPRSTADYVHRIGRTGRAGETGVAVSFVTPEAEAHFRLIEKRNRLRLPREQIAGFSPAPDTQVRSENGVKSVSRS